MEQEIKLIQEETEKLLEKIGVAGKIEVSTSEDGYFVLINSDDSALLIGRHGNTLASLEYVLSFIIASKLGEYKRVIVEVGGYRKEREEYLKNLAARLKEEVIDTGSEKQVRGLRSWERRLIHMVFSEDSEITTESQGEGKDRVLVIKKK